MHSQVPLMAKPHTWLCILVFGGAAVGLSSHFVTRYLEIIRVKQQCEEEPVLLASPSKAIFALLLTSMSVCVAACVNGMPVFACKQPVL